MDKKLVIRIGTYLGGPIDAAVDFGARWRQTLKPLLKKLFERLIEMIAKEYPDLGVVLEFSIDDPIAKTEETLKKSIDDVHKELAHLQLFERRTHANVVFDNIIVPDIDMVLKLKRKDIGFATVYFAPDTRTSGTHIELLIASGVYYKILEKISGEKLKLAGIHKIAAKPLTTHIISPGGLPGVLAWPDAISAYQEDEGKIFISFSEYLNFLETWLLIKIREKIENHLKAQ